MAKKVIGIIIVFAIIGVLIVVIIGATGADKKISSAKFNKTKEFVLNGKLEEAKDSVDKIAAEDPDYNGLGKMYFEIADAYEKRGETIKARDIYGLILNKYQNVDNVLEAQNRLSKLNIEILFSPAITERDISYEVKPGDTLSKISKEFGVTIDLIKMANSLKGDTIKAGSKLKITKARYKILVDKSQNILTLLFDDGSLLKTYKVSTGTNNCTPVGTFKIVNKIVDPVWYNEGAVVPSESPDNILGSRWLGISEKGYGIHGTTQPEKLGMQATKGCVRMLNAEVEELYTIVPLDTEVIIVD